MNNGTTINTGTYLLSILQDDYNHNQSLADSYEKLAEGATTAKDKKQFRNEHKAFHEKAIQIYCAVNKLMLMEDRKVDHVSNLNQNYRIFRAKQKTEGSV